MDAINPSSFFSKAILQNLRASDRNQTFELIHKFWPDLDPERKWVHEQYYTCFFEYICQELASLRHHHTRFAAEIFNTTCGMIGEPKKIRIQPRKTIMKTLQRDFLNYDDKALLRSMELTL